MPHTFLIGSGVQIELIPAFNDNYLFVALDPDKRQCFVVDPGDAGPILDFLSKHDLTLAAILITHHHADHVGGVRQLLAQTGCTRVVGPSYDIKRIPFITEAVKDRDVVDVLGYSALVRLIPGHTRGHISYYFAEENALFCGDTLFSVGCGRMFEGNKEQMWRSLELLRALPEETQVYCAHEYTLANIKFALSVDGENKDLLTYHEQCKARLSKGLPTIPTTIGLEKRVNPFLRVDVPEFRRAANRRAQTPAELFGILRAAKDESGGWDDPIDCH